MKCPRCQQQNPTDQKFCGECGTPLQRIEESTSAALAYAGLEHSLTEALDQQTATSEILASDLQFACWLAASSCRLLSSISTSGSSGRWC
jgi:hypothetical protein